MLLSPHGYTVLALLLTYPHKTQLKPPLFINTATTEEIKAYIIILGVKNKPWEDMFISRAFVSFYLITDVKTGNFKPVEGLSLIQV